MAGGLSSIVSQSVEYGLIDCFLNLLLQYNYAEVATRKLSQAMHSLVNFHHKNNFIGIELDSESFNVIKI